MDDLLCYGCSIDRTGTVGHFSNQKFAKIFKIPGQKKERLGYKGFNWTKKNLDNLSKYLENTVILCLM